MSVPEGSKPARSGKPLPRPVPADFSDAAQDYIREIYKLQGESDQVRT
jgi:hypothetical protein